MFNKIFVLAKRVKAPYVFNPLFLLVVLLLASSNIAVAYQLEIKQIPASQMAQSYPATIVLPNRYQQTSGRFPVLYLLHGYGGDHQNWSTETTIPSLADQYNIIIVMPDGAIDKWYTDSPVNPQWRYASYLAQDVVAYVDKHYRTIASAAGRGISGLSMGGYGALHIGIQHPELFGALASTSGGVDPRPFAGRWNLNAVLGEPTANSNNWQDAAIISHIAKLKTQSQALYLDCGNEDFFIEVNRQLHQALREQAIPHYYAEWPGSHNWHYWRSSIEYQLVFFSQFFAKSR
ncbi:hypothetical protein GCM10010919_24120 [Alishewanella longhuensis]|uniref:XynC protein n=1 Tax=Alishewanella longhuensis TaxID=1091037 RepID=A0ABQ3L8B4_9ALTE|nr:alpha/beta hydrolase family protein [Alishewanella longhuensis]GHG72122.1 hypothetical protein GCM10010919_24120 [Alishewanella longhuensis]